MLRSKKQKETVLFYFLAALIIILAGVACCLIFYWHNQATVRTDIDISENNIVEVWQDNKQVDNNQIIPKRIIQPLVINDEPTASFSDIFSNDVWLNSDETTFLRNDSAMTLTFEPKIEVQEAGVCPANFTKENHCLGENCLEIKDNKIFYNQKLINLPSQDEAVLNLAILPVVDKWLVAGVRKSGEDYQPLLWWFDGQNFSTIVLPLVNDQPPTIRYLGNFGLGRAGRSVLVLYSAEDGLAWQINDQEIKDLKYLFSARINNGGFKPGIVAFGQGKKTIWYVYDAASERLRWLKFWQNDTEWIEGAISLANFLPKNVKQAVISIKEGERPQLNVFAYDNKKECQQYEVVDNGFKQEKYQIESSSVTAYDKNKSPITKARINKVLGGWSSFNNKWQLSFDNKIWQDIEIGQSLEGANSAGDLWWRWQVEPNEDRYKSPCLKMVNLVFWR